MTGTRKPYLLNPRIRLAEREEDGRRQERVGQEHHRCANAVRVF